MTLGTQTVFATSRGPTWGSSLLPPEMSGVRGEQPLDGPPALTAPTVKQQVALAVTHKGFGKVYNLDRLLAKYAQRV